MQGKKHLGQKVKNHLGDILREINVQYYQSIYKGKYFLNIKVKMMGGITARKRVIIKGKHCNRNENKY